MPTRATWSRWLACATTTAALWSGLASAQPVANGGPNPPPATCPALVWPLYQAFLSHFVQPDGRVLDASTPRLHSSSEGQSYGMFFALVADDPATFDKLWRWTINNLMAGQPASTLPAWFWGVADDGKWGVLDKNSAADADLWFVYALLEAGRAWARDDYVRDARALLANVERQEIVDLPGLGPMLLPGAYGFARDDKTWQLNPSYLPLPVLRRLAAASPQGGWHGVAESTARMLTATTPKGFVADWVSYAARGPHKGGFINDPVKGDLGSYDAIRTYMWAGMIAEADPLASSVQRAVRGLAAATAASADGAPPEKVRVMSGATEGVGPFGFSASLLPYLEATGQIALAQSQRLRVDRLQAVTLRPESLAARQPPYYDYVLSLFGTGWSDRRFRFTPTGALQLLWEESCPHAATR